MAEAINPRKPARRPVPLSCGRAQKVWLCGNVETTTSAMKIMAL